MGELDPGAPDATAVAEALPPGGAVAIANAPSDGSEKRSQVITWFVGFAMLWLVMSYTATGICALFFPPSKDAYEFVSTMQLGLKDFILMVLGGFLGAITQKHA